MQDGEDDHDVLLHREVHRVREATKESPAHAGRA
jgi:hypothetical protein